jgi:uncharacterized protein YukE
MIIGGGASPVAGIEPFPQPPKGSPGEIRAAAQSLRVAAEDLQSAHGTLGMAAGLLGSWEGQAAAAYHGCVQGLAKVIHGGVSSLHAVIGVVRGYASALDQAQSGIKRLEPAYNDAVRRARLQAGVLAGLNAAMPSATKAERRRLVGLATGAESRAQGAVDEANGYARHATRLLQDFQREAGRQSTRLAPFDMQLYGGRLGAPIGAPGPNFGAGTVDNGFANALAPFSGVIPVQLAGPHGPSLFARLMDGVQSISGVVTTVSGACSALLFWNGVGEGCGVVGGISSGIGGAAAVAKTIAGDGSVGSAAVGVAEAAPGLGSFKLGKDGAALIKAGEASGQPALVNAGQTKRALGGIIDGVGGTASSRSLGELANGAEPAHVSAGTIDRAAGQGIANELGQIETILAGPGVLGRH